MLIFDSSSEIPNSTLREGETILLGEPGNLEIYPVEQQARTGGIQTKNNLWANPKQTEEEAESLLPRMGYTARQETLGLN